MSINPNRTYKKFDLPTLTNSGTEYQYIGESAPGSSTSDDVWFIKRLTFTDGIITDLQSTGHAATWDDRVSELYS